MKVDQFYIYGCSFSHDFWISKDDIYPHLLSKKMKREYVTRAEPAICHDETYLRLTKDLDRFQKNDFIVYQFTSGDREGYMINNDSLYLTSSALSRDLKYYAYVLDRWGKGRKEYKVSDAQLITLLDYIDAWTPKTLYYKYHRVFNTLEFLKNTVGINYVMIFLDNKFNKYLTKNYIKFPIDTIPDNNSILFWARENNWNLGSSRPKEVPEDMHPDEKGHFGVFEKILEYIENDGCK